MLHPSFPILFLQLLRSVLGTHPLKTGYPWNWHLLRMLFWTLPNNVSKLCTCYWTFVLPAYDYTFSCAITTMKFAFLHHSFFPFATQAIISRHSVRFLHSLLFAAGAWSKGLVLILCHPNKMKYLWPKTLSRVVVTIAAYRMLRASLNHLELTSLSSWTANTGNQHCSYSA